MLADHQPPPLREHLCAPTTRHALKIQRTVLAAAREYLATEGFDELLAPIIGPVTDPGSRGAKQVDIDYYGHRYKLMTSAILYKQVSLLTYEKIFYVAPNVRLEPLETSTTRRHLTEFHQLDVEIRGASRDAAMRVAQQVVHSAIDAVAGDCAVELEHLNRTPEDLRRWVERDFPEISHSDAVAELNRLGHHQHSGTEIGWEAEEKLSATFDRPTFITDYPKGSRGFYDRESSSQPRSLTNFDLIAPDGFGEIASGGERENEHAKIVTRIRETGENPGKYGWYLAIAKDGMPASAGFGIGVERLVRFIANLDAVWQASAYPKIPGAVSP